MWLIYLLHKHMQQLGMKTSQKSNNIIIIIIIIMSFYDK